jgi:deoxyribonuclease V
LTPRQAVALQRELAGRIYRAPFPGLPRRVAGADVSCARFGKTLWGGLVVLDRFGWRVIESSVVSMAAPFPYVPGLLSFRELPVLMAAAERLASRPEVVLVDGQGVAHPRRLGLAAHLGLVWNLPTVGCAKSRLVGETRGMPGSRRGCRRLLYDGGESIGVLLRTRSRVKPMWVSPGHRMDIESAYRITLACTGAYRIPEPVRAAHRLVNEARRGERNQGRGSLIRRDPPRGRGRALPA